MEKEVARLEERVSVLEAETTKILANLEGIQTKYDVLNTSLMKIELHSEYTRAALDEIKQSVHDLTTKSTQHDYVEPLTKRLNREEKIIGVILVAVVIYLLSIIAPGIPWK